MLTCRAICTERVGVTFAQAVTIELIPILMLCKCDNLCEIDAHAKVTVQFLIFFKSTVKFYKKCLSN